MAQQGYGCYVVNPISGTNLIQGLARIAAQNTPVVNIDSPIDADAAEKADVDVTTYIGTDNSEAGRRLATPWSRPLGGSGTVALIGGISGDVTSGARIDGFKEAVDGKLTTLPDVAADWDRQIALTKATDILAANPDVKGFFAANDDMALGIVRAVANAGRPARSTSSASTASRTRLQSVESGDLYATVAQYPYAIGQMGVQACQKARPARTPPRTSPPRSPSSPRTTRSRRLPSSPPRSSPSTNPLKLTSAGTRIAEIENGRHDPMNRPPPEQTAQRQPR